MKRFDIAEWKAKREQEGEILLTTEQVAEMRGSEQDQPCLAACLRTLAPMQRAGRISSPNQKRKNTFPDGTLIVFPSQS